MLKSVRNKSGKSIVFLDWTTIMRRRKYIFNFNPIFFPQPPTRDDWISGIREAVDNCSPGSDSEGGYTPGALSSAEEVLRRKTESKHLRQRRLCAELRSKDIELAKLLEDKMNIMKEMLQVVASGPDHDQVPEQQQQLNDSFVAADKLPSLDLPQPDYISLVRCCTLKLMTTGGVACPREMSVPIFMHF